MIQINSMYANDGQTVVTLFLGDDGKMLYTVDDIVKSSKKQVALSVKVSDDIRIEMLQKAEKVWGYDQNLYVLKTFNPWSKELGLFILHCWHEIRANEPELLSK